MAPMGSETTTVDVEARNFPMFFADLFLKFWWAGANKKSDDLVQQSEV